MSEAMNGLKRTHYCAEAAPLPAGSRITVAGWVQKARKLGSNLIFVDLRDRSGLLQLAFDQDTDRAVFEKAASLGAEDVIVLRAEFVKKR